MAQNQPNDYAIVPSAVHSRRSLVTQNRGMEIEQAIGEIGQATLETIGNITRAAAGHVRAAGAVRDMLKKGAEATREIPQEEADAEREIYKMFLDEAKTVASYTGMAALTTQAQTTQRLQTRTLADEFEDFGAGLADTLLGRPGNGGHPPLLNSGR